MRILAVNAGSTSLKLSLVGDGDATLATSELRPPGEAEARVHDFLGAHGAADAVCVRLVHGGPRLRQAVIVDDSVRAELDTAAAMAPLHVPAVLHLLDTLRRTMQVPFVACFDTAFHAEMPDAAATYAIPEQWREEYGVRRYGFHGLSCAWSLGVAATTLQRDPRTLQILIAHLGGGCSVTAAREGHGVDTTMGFSPLEGLVMATRSGTVDPAAILWLQLQHALPAADIADALETRSGLLSLAGTADFAAIVERAAGGDAAAQRALDVFVHRVRSGVGAMAMSLDRVDALVFTGGIGEHSALVRDRVTRSWINPAKVLVVPAREDLQMVREARAALSAQPAAS